MFKGREIETCKKKENSINYIVQRFPYTRLNGVGYSDCIIKKKKKRTPRNAGIHFT